ncbi:unnamed protein product [Ambrosiozyma monospora]|uniref:Unnamed protein product n=1 Tax=Ambrosiozyma monospora TaxID=43982 RepID=A0A9W6YTG2_AMBMO|nr:unnamed protein product [Ambrosiozyma monospora]
MSTIHQQQPQPSDAEQERLRNAGITTMPTGRLRLPPILIQYSNGNTQHLIIEVGQPLRSRASQIPSIRINLNGDNVSRARQQGQVQDQNEGQPAPVPASASTSGDTPSTATTTTGNNSDNDNNGQLQRQGIRGIDYPAFDTSLAGVFNPNEVAAASGASDLLSSLILPIQRALEANEARRRQQAMTTMNPTSTPAPDDSTNTNTTSTSSSNLTDAPTTTATSSTIAPVNGNNQNSQSRPAQADHRNIILTVNYMFGEDDNNVLGTQNSSGSLVLHVPSIHERNDANVQVLIRLATTIALRTVSVYLQRSKGVSDEDFAKLEIKHIDDLLEADRQCAICYDCYESFTEEKVVDVDEGSTNGNGKRKRDSTDDKDGAEGPSLKVGKTGEDGTPVATDTESSSSDNQSQIQPKTTTKPKKTIKEQTISLHIPVVMPCGHIFGRSCLREWLKTHSSCPLCRNKITSTGRNGGPLGDGATITLPNLARVISRSQSAISQFNDRPMSFIMPEQNAEFQADEIFGEQVTVPITTTPINLPNANRFLNTTTTGGDNTNGGVGNGDGNGVDNNDAVGVIGRVLRSVFDRILGARQTNIRTDHNSILNNAISSARPQLHQHSHNLNDTPTQIQTHTHTHQHQNTHTHTHTHQQPHMGTVPVVRRNITGITSSGSTSSSMMRQLTRRRMLNRRRAMGRHSLRGLPRDGVSSGPEGTGTDGIDGEPSARARDDFNAVGSNEEFVNRNPMFPVGVESRRDANGVVRTVAIDGTTTTTTTTSTNASSVAGAGAGSIMNTIANTNNNVDDPVTSTAVTSTEDGATTNPSNNAENENGRAEAEAETTN